MKKNYVILGFIILALVFLMIIGPYYKNSSVTTTPPNATVYEDEYTKFTIPAGCHVTKYLRGDYFVEILNSSNEVIGVIDVEDKAIGRYDGRNLTFIQGRQGYEYSGARDGEGAAIALGTDYLYIKFKPGNLNEFNTFKNSFVLKKDPPATQKHVQNQDSNKPYMPPT